MPIFVIALTVVLVMGVGLITIYFSGVLVFKLINIFSGDIALTSSSLPYVIKKSLKEARGYADRIKKTAHQYPPSPMRDRLDLIVKPVNESLVNLNRLEQALAKLYTQHNLARELLRVTADIARLRRQLLTANKGEVASLRSLLQSKEKHLEALQELQSFQNQAELKIRKIASDLGTTHTEMLLVTTKGDFNDNRFQRLDENLQDNLTGLRDILSAMDEMGYSSANHQQLHV